MFFNAEDDEQDFLSTGGSKLASVFGLDKATGQGGNASLTYTAPKQPKKKAADVPAADSGAVPAVIVATVVHAYKYVDNKYVSQGKLGAALLLTQATSDYRILLYVNKQQQVTSGKITPTFSFSIQQNNYATFYDDARQMWSIMFDTSEAAEKFSREMALARANAGPLTELVQQDLNPGDGGGLEAGDSAEVKYTGWLLANRTFGKVFDQSAADSSFRLKVGKGKVIKGWDQGMLGMKKGGKRLLIIPPSLAYGPQGAGDKVPPNSVLIFEIQVLRVKLQKGESAQTSQGSIPLPTMAQVPDEDDLDGQMVKDRSRSINEQSMHSAADSDKAKLISRMARMGQPMLPFQGAIAAQPDDSDEDLHNQTQQAAAAAHKPALPTKPRSSSGAGLHVPVGQVIISQSLPTGINASYNMAASQPVMLTSTAESILQQQQQSAFLQNLPGAQQLAVYQNPNTYLQQQQAALLQQQQLIQQQQQQQQQLIQQQQQQQQLLGQGLTGQFSAYAALATPPQPPSQHSSSTSTDALAPVLLTETRQQNTEVRIGISKMADKVDKILEKVDHLSASGQAAHAMGMITPYGGNFQAPSMEANVLMQNISRIVQENERLKKEVYEQSNKVQELNDKISNLLEKNQKYVEQSQNLLEQRNEGYKMTASQSQAKVLSLEQEKIHLATELSSASAQITTLQLELGDYRKREGELKQQLQASSSLSSNSRDELERLRLQKEEDEHKINNLTTNVRDEKLTRKSLESKLASYQEEIAEMKTAKETLEKNLSERKRKATEERRKLEEDLEDAKINYEATIEDLREKLRKQKSSVDVDTQSKISKIEEEISKDWQSKSERMVAATSEKYSRQLLDLRDEKEELLLQVADLEKKLVTIRSSGSSTEQQLTQLQDELSEMKVWKDKYDNLRTQAGTMKDKYEKRIQELETEKDEDEERKNDTADKTREQNQEQQQKVQQLQQEVQQLRSELSVSKTELQRRASTASATSTVDVATEVKKIMNSVFQTLRGEFDAEDSYQGSEVMVTILNVIKQTTLKLVSLPPPAREESMNDEDEGESNEEEEDDEEKEVDERKLVEVDEFDDDDDDDDVDGGKGAKIPEVNKPPELEVDEVSEVTVSKEELLLSSKLSADQTRLPTALPESEEPSEDSQVEAGVKTALHGDKIVAASPSAASTSSDGDITTAYENLPSLDDNSIDKDVVDKAANDSENYVVSDGDDEDHFFESDEGDNDESDRKETLEETKINSLANNDSQSNPEIKNVSEIGTRKHETSELSTSNSVPATAQLDDRGDNESFVQASKKAADVAEDVKTAKDKTESVRAEDKSLQDVFKEPRLNAAPKPDSNDSREPPPLFDDDDDDDDSPLFGNDSHVNDTLGSSTTKSQTSVNDNHAKVKSAGKTVSPSEKSKTTPGKKQESVNDEDLKPQPPPPLFGDDSDDDDFDWLS